MAKSARTVLRTRARHLPSGGVIHTRLVTGRTSFRDGRWWGVTEWGRPTIFFDALAEAEALFEHITIGMDEVTAT